MQVTSNETFREEEQSNRVIHMAVRFGKLLAAISLMVAVWALSPQGALIRTSSAGSWVRPSGAAPGPVKILQFYSSVGSIKAGEKALLCYGVENAKSVRIAPLMEGEAPSANRCLEVSPVHTTHYTILAEGFDGHIAMQSLTLPVDSATPGSDAPPDRPRWLAILVGHALACPA
ncbi:MAG TPA: hypothetical protein VLW65_16825 [Bryobacteraceae bacterium]|nr:hypothetical protein [Bryobacteraceae bacterium]